MIIHRNNYNQFITHFTYTCYELDFAQSFQFEDILEYTYTNLCNKENKQVMNPKIEVIKSKLREDDDFEKFRRELKQFAETHKLVNVSTTMDTQGLIIYATILYEETDTTTEGTQFE